MTGDAPISWLMFVTLFAGLAVAGGFMISFLRSRHNREIAAIALEGDGRSRRLEPSGAGAELIGLFVVALIAMALLTAGYSARRDAKPTPQGTTQGTTQGSAEPNNSLATPRTDPGTPKPYQPQNPEPDTRSSPTGSPAGVGSDSGGRPEQEPKR